MELYNISAKAAILDMQISWFSNSTREIHQRVFRKKIVKIWWALATGERLRRYWICKLAHVGHVEYANQLFSNSTRMIYQRVLRKKFAKIRWILGTGECLRWSWICKLAHGGHVKYMQISWFSNSDRIIHQRVFRKKNCEDRMNIGDCRALIETKFLYFLFLTWLSIIRNQEFRLYI